MTTIAHWYDLSRNRRVEFFVHYSLHNGSLDVNEIRSTGITFYQDGNTSKIVRQIKVQTQRGKKLLIDQLFDSGEAYNLTLSLAQKHGLLATTD